MGKQVKTLKSLERTLKSNRFFPNQTRNPKEFRNITIVFLLNERFLTNLLMTDCF